LAYQNLIKDIATEDVGEWTISNKIPVFWLSGPYRMHLTGYQPQVAVGEEFCEDIPAAGNAIIVLDYVDEPLRDMMAGVYVIEKDSWTAAQSTAGDNEAKAILDIPPKIYKTGSLKIEHGFDKPGYFVGFLTAEKERAHKWPCRSEKNRIFR
jgi:hypothetical protein